MHTYTTHALTESEYIDMNPQVHSFLNTLKLIFVQLKK